MTNFIKETRKSSIHKKITYNVKFNFFIKDMIFISLPIHLQSQNIYLKKYRLLAVFIINDKKF